MNRTALIKLFAAVLACLPPSAGAGAQQREVSKEPVHIIDASTGKPIPEVLIIPRYSSFEGVSTLLGEGPGRGTERDYLARPYVYRSGARFGQKLPKSVGFMLPPFLWIGKGRSLESVLVVAPGYRPEWFSDFWPEPGEERKLRLTPATDDEWALLLEKRLGPLEQNTVRLIEGDCGFWHIPTPLGLPAACKLEIHYGKKERALVRSFLRRPVKRD
ncbi:MAG TPA: hypothetical protein VGX48_14870 [Pyrinomonadaceae bacterium]|jgi:hypothetical protein|nr:hypothetical protein [Pyrinomonadaceae bacterium]